MRENAENCCGTCKYHFHENVSDDWVCVNFNSEYFSDFTDYEHTCPEASQAGTALRAVINRMAKESIVPMQELGISLDDGEGGIKSFKQVMDDLYLWKEGNGGMIP